MTTTSSSMRIIQHDPATDALSPGTLRDLRFLRTEDLESENRYLRECRQDVIDDGGDGSQFEPTIVAISNELERRRQRLNRYGNDILRPDWPRMHEKRYQDLLADANDLKAIWPIDRYMSVVVGVELVRSGSRPKCRCPLNTHDDKTPSFVLFTDSNRYKCFGCGEAGDIFTITGLFFGITSFADQVRKVAEVTGSIMKSTRAAAETYQSAQDELGGALHE